MAEFFGYELFKKTGKKDKDPTLPLPSFQAPIADDGAITVSEGGWGYNALVETDAQLSSDVDLIQRYRDMAMQSDVEAAIDEIVNQMIANDPDEDPVKIVLDDIEVGEGIKKKVEDEFSNILSLLNFKYQAYDIARKWYVDARLIYDMITDNDKPADGIKELRQIDPLKIRKVRVIEKQKLNDTKVEVPVVKDEYFIFNEAGFGKQKNFIADPRDVKGLKIPKDRIAYITSGLVTPKQDQVLGFLHKAIRPLNMLRSMEDATLIYTITRATERRIFYIDVGTLPPAKASQYMRDMMTKFKNKVAYDPSTGEIKDDRKYMTLIEDFWLPRRGEKGTEITTLPGGDRLVAMDQLMYFQKNLYKALNVPADRLDNDAMNNLGRPSEISREEIKFNKFIERLRLKFQNLFSEILGRQLMMKNIITEQDWAEWKNKIDYRFANDNYFSELKEIEIMQERITLLQQMEQFSGRYYSNKKLRTSILRQTEQEMAEEDKQIELEKTMPQYNPPEIDPDNPQYVEPEEEKPEPPKPEPAPKPAPTKNNVNVHVKVDGSKTAKVSNKK